MHKARRFINTFHFIDDLCATNTMVGFKNVSKGSTLDKKIRRKKTFLALRLHCLVLTKRQKIIKVQLSFMINWTYSPFEIIHMVFFQNNIPSKIFYSFLGSDILHLARNTSDHFTIIMLVDKLLNRISKQGSQKMDIKILLNKIFDCHFEAFIILYIKEIETFKEISYTYKFFQFWPKDIYTPMQKERGNSLPKHNNIVYFAVQNLTFY